LTAALLVVNARAADGAPTQVLARDGRIEALGAHVAAPPEIERYDAGGRLLLPGLVEGHVHLDKTLLGLPFLPHMPGETIASRIAAERQLRRTVPLSVEARGAKLIEQLSAYGTTALRTHVDIDAEAGLSGLQALLKLKQRYARLVDMQIVAFPQSGVLREPGVADLLDAAVREGADFVGGLDPQGIDGDAAGHLDAIFAVADRRGVGLDIHLHDGGATGARELQMIAERAKALGLNGRVVVSHAFCLGELDEALFAATAAALSEAGVAIMTTAPGPVPMPPVKRLRERGVRVFSGSDNIRDAWSPFGNGDLIERAAIICDRQNFRADADLALAFDLVTQEAAAATGLGGGRLAAGARADFLLVEAASVAEAVAARPAARTVFKRGLRVAGRL
jgi:cytosine/adenosine deaminase-related metal-dependent hydrolase